MKLIHKLYFQCRSFSLTTNWKIMNCFCKNPANWKFFSFLLVFSILFHKYDLVESLPVDQPFWPWILQNLIVKQFNFPHWNRFNNHMNIWLDCTCLRFEYFLKCISHKWCDCTIKSWTPLDPFCINSTLRKPATILTFRENDN